VLECQEEEKRGYHWSANLSPYICFEEHIIAQVALIDKPFFLHFHVNGDGTEWIDAGLPTPNYFYRFTGALGASTYCIAYLIDGYFRTEKNMRYLNDIIARFILTLPIRERLMWEPSEEHKQLDQVYKLKEFQELKSLTRKYVPKLNGHMAGDDPKFWELKLYIEHRTRDNGGEGSYVAFDMVLNHALAFYEFKDLSTARAKTRNIWNWYESRGFKYHILKHKKGKEEVMATRQEQIVKARAALQKQKKEKVYKAIVGLQFFQEKLSARNVAAQAGVSKDTAAKYLREWRLEQDLKSAAQ
jgi:hypothetical protein